MSAQVWVVDDDGAVNAMMYDFLIKNGYQTQSFESADIAFDKLKSLSKEEISEIDVIVTDLNMPGMGGLEFVERMKKLAPDIPIIIVTAYATIDSAIEATKKGAYCYISKPFKLAEFEVNVYKAVQLSRLKKENYALKNQVKEGWKFGQIIGKSQPMLELYSQIKQVAKARATVLITGESGTGKELVAKAIHESSDRARKPFVAINCTAIPENLLESELFGHIKGAFTGAYENKVGLFEEANGGTIFLDEIGDLDIYLQAKILRVLQEMKIKPVGASKEKSVDVRVVAATNKDLVKAMEEGDFREDLYYRLGVLPLYLPKLSERKQDIPLLAHFFLKKYASLNSSGARTFSAEAINLLMNYKWPGNVRELENVVERAVVISNSETIDIKDLPQLEKTTPDEFFMNNVGDWPTLEEFSNKYIKYILDKTGGKKEKASEILGINRRTIYRKEKEFVH